MSYYKRGLLIYSGKINTTLGKIYNVIYLLWQSVQMHAMRIVGTRIHVPSLPYVQYSLIVNTHLTIRSLLLGINPNLMTERKHEEYKSRSFCFFYKIKSNKQKQKFTSWRKRDLIFNLLNIHSTSHQSLWFCPPCKNWLLQTQNVLCRILDIFKFEIYLVHNFPGTQFLNYLW